MHSDDEHLRRVEAALTRPELEVPPLPKRRACFRLSRRPGRRSIWEAWVVMAPLLPGNGSHVLREARVDRNALAQGSPDAIAVRDVELTQEVVEGWMNALRAIRIPVGGVEVSMGLDGTTYTLSVEVGMASASLRWWHDGPEAWSELTAWTRSTMRELRERLG